MNNEFLCLKDIKSFKKGNTYFGNLVHEFKYDIYNNNESIVFELKLILYKENNLPKHEVSNEYFRLKD